jgi:hypothetical protein
MPGFEPRELLYQAGALPAHPSYIQVLYCIILRQIESIGKAVQGWHSSQSKPSLLNFQKILFYLIPAWPSIFIVLIIG